ncbi:RagB/SusD family nutrient uptake outer membrane protein [Geofilum sp. OHC36d9]|uniref:RagB/SusD family nutrient uptake outer membrane protein n=1 Tax=Geofilum sp. OHC36d9 TaxID=3458413 RepID=UPI004034B93C
MEKLLYIWILAIVTGFTACTEQLDQYPEIEDTSESVYSNPANYLSVLGKCYASFVIAGQEKGGGNVDLSSNNGFDYMRNYLNLQEVGTDEIGYTWVEGDNLTALSYLSWDANDPFLTDMYYRIYYTISLCNEFIKNSTDEAIASFTRAEQDEIVSYRAEARFLRALAYYHALDLYHDVAFADESIIGEEVLPERWESVKIFNYIEKELLECSIDMPTADNCEYGHAPQAAAWMLLARLYLNAPVYEAGDYYSQCKIYSQKVIDEGYVLESDYASLFNADNDLRTGKGHEIIFPLVVDSRYVVSWGASTYMVCGSVDSDYGPSPNNQGVDTPWNSFRMKGELTSLFDMENDSRALFFVGSQSQYMDGGVADRTGGYLSYKWSNLKDDGSVASLASNDGVDTDFPLFRLADAYLMYAEAAARSNTDLSIALNYVNTLRNKRNLSAVAESDLVATVDAIPYKFFLDERGREFYLEGLRRTDLIRFSCFTSSDYLWQWKGGVKDGAAVDDKYSVYPIPATELMANPNLWNENY